MSDSEGGGLTIRAMEPSDTAPCAGLLRRALDRLRAELGLPAATHARHGEDVAARRIAHVLQSDRDSSLVATNGATVVGFGQATRSGDCWVLVHLFVEPEHQSSGVGSELLRPLHAAGRDANIGLIGLTADPRAIGAYARLAGFRVHPTIRAEGVMQRRPERSRLVHPGTVEEATQLDRVVRGSARASDLLFLLREGYELTVLSGRGYVVSNAEDVATLAATDEEAARSLLVDALARTDTEAHLELPRMTGNQQWAISVAVDAGLRLRPWGPFVIRGLDAAPSPYLPHPALC